MLDPEAMARLEQARDLWNSLGRGRIDNLDAPTLGVIADALKHAYEAGVEDAAKVAGEMMTRLNTDYRHEIRDAIRALKGTT